MSTSHHARRLRAPALALGLAVVVAAKAGAASPLSPILKGPYLQDLGPAGVVVRVEVDPPAALTIELRRAGPPDGKPTEVADDVARSLHSIALSGLEPQTTYRYRVRVGRSVSAEASFTTAPKPDSSAPFRFIAYGDDRSDDTAHASVVRALLDAPSDLLVHTGDFVEDGSNAVEWQTFFDIEGPLLASRCLFACVGNHELVERSGASFLRYFGPTAASDGDDAKKKLYGSFRWSNARFFLLNGMDAWSNGIEKTWLEEELARADSEAGLAWRFVVVHYGPWSAGPHGKNERFLDAGVVPILTRHKVDLVLSGHDHIYERGEAEGLRYVVSGGGGAPLYRVASPLPSTRKVESTYHFVEASVTPDAVKLVAKRVDGSILDRCGFTKSAGWDCDPLRAPSKAASDAPTASKAANDAAGSPSKCACRVAGSSGGSQVSRSNRPSDSDADLWWAGFAGALAVGCLARRRPLARRG